MNDKKLAPDLAGIEGLKEKSNCDSQNTRLQDRLSTRVNFVSGFGKFHTNKPGKETRRPYSVVTLADIRAMVDEPPSVPKAKGQWFIPSTHLSRGKDQQREHGDYGMLWSDLDKDPKPLNIVEDAVDGILAFCDYEIYTSRSATVDRPKCRILVPLAAPLSPAEWLACQRQLNDDLEAAGLIPDRVTERLQQLCYLPNRGEHYETRSVRNGNLYSALDSLRLSVSDFELPAKQALKPRSEKDANDPLVDFLYDEGHVRHADQSGRVDIECPWSDHHTTDTGHSATSYFPAGVGGIAVGRFACLHSHCAHRTTQEFKREIGYDLVGFEEIPDPPATSGAPLPLPAFTRLSTGRDAGKIEATRNNLALALDRPDICGHALRFDSFLDALMIGVNSKWREFVDEDHYAIALCLEQGETAFKHIPADMLRECVKFTCRNNTFDTAQAWLNDLTWDGVPRVATFLSTFVGATDNPYTRAVSRYFWSALAGRVLVPGVKADMALIAVGEQGARKTSLVHALVPDERFAGELDLSDKSVDIARVMRGKLVMELGELKGFSRPSVEHLKAFISRQKEEWTPKYKEFTTTVHRRCLFFGTTNNEEILVDETGNRRWLPFHSAGANPEALAAVRDQLWAEGAALFEKHGVLWQDAERLAKDEHAEFTVSDVWDSAVYDWLYDPYERFMPDGKTLVTTPAEWGFTISEVLHGAVRLEVSKQTKGHETRMGRILKRLGFAKKQQRVPKNAKDKSTKSDRARIYRPADSE